MIERSYDRGSKRSECPVYYDELAFFVVEVEFSGRFCNLISLAFSTVLTCSSYSSAKP